MDILQTTNLQPTAKVKILARMNTYLLPSLTSLRGNCSAGSSSVSMFSIRRRRSGVRQRAFSWSPAVCSLPINAIWYNHNQIDSPNLWTIMHRFFVASRVARFMFLRILKTILQDICNNLWIESRMAQTRMSVVWTPVQYCQNCSLAALTIRASQVWSMPFRPGP